MNRKLHSVFKFTVFILFFSEITAASDLKSLKLHDPIKETPREFTISLELNSGLKDSKDITDPLFTGSARLYGEISYLKNKARIEPFIGGAFVNPGGSFELGLRNDFSIFPIKSGKLPIGELRAGVGYFYSFYHKVNYVSADLKLEALDLIFLKLTFNKCLNNSEYIISTGFGVNL